MVSAGNVITGRWHAQGSDDPQFALVATIEPDGSIDLAGSEDPENLGLKQVKLVAK